MKLFKKKAEQSSGKFISTFTKIWVNRIMWFGSIWITLPYVLAFLGVSKTVITPLVSLSKLVVTVVISTMLGYFVKSFMETKEEKSHELKVKKLENSDYKTD